jgi:hypothetical protein
MSSLVLQFATSLVGPFIELRKTIQEYQRKSKEKEQLKEDLTNALQAETKEYEALTKEMSDFAQRFLSIIQKIDEQPTPGQLLDIVNCLSQTPRILAKQIISFVHLARACKDISNQKAFMNSLLNTNRFMYDFIERMSSAYIGKNTVKIDSSFFRFILMYKREILKYAKVGKIDKEKMRLLEKGVKSAMRGLNEPFLKRHLRVIAVKRWKSSLATFSRVAKDIEIESEGTDISILGDFIPRELKQLAPFLDKSP